MKWISRCVLNSWVFRMLSAYAFPFPCRPLIAPHGSDDPYSCALYEISLCTSRDVRVETPTPFLLDQLLGCLRQYGGVNMAQIVCTSFFCFVNADCCFSFLLQTSCDCEFSLQLTCVSLLYTGVTFFRMLSSWMLVSSEGSQILANQFAASSGFLRDFSSCCLSL